MISIINKDDILSDHEIFELTRSFFNNEEIRIGKGLVASDVSFSLNLIRNKFSYKGVLVDSNNKTYTKEIQFDKVNIYRDEGATRRIIGKQIIYLLFKRALDLSLPFGILTGVRPSKIVSRLLRLNLTYKEIYEVLTSQYLLSPQKAKLLLDIGELQKSALKDRGRNTYSIYVNIPFCPTRCSYCSFISLDANKYESLMESYVDALIKELEETRKTMEGFNINSLYIGGGTPTSLKVNLMERLIYETNNKFPNIKEYSIEGGRPETLDINYLKLFKKYNIDRISINPQTMNNQTLKRINRPHTREDVINCFNKAREVGINSINMDLILGLPGEEINDLKNTLKEIEKLKPDNLTAHVLAIKTGSAYKDIDLPNTVKESNKINEMIKHTSLLAKEMEMQAYYLYRQKNSLGNFENVGYSLKDKLCLYNISIMEEKETIIGLGMGAVSKIYDREFDKHYRLPNYKNLQDYMEHLDKQIARKNMEIEKLKRAPRDIL